MANNTNQNNRSKVFRGIGVQTIINGVLGILGILYFSIMSRLLTEEDFGYFAIVIAVTTILKSLTQAGLGASVIQSKNNSAEFVSTAFTLSLCLGLVFTLIMFIFAGFFSQIMVKSEILVWGYRIMSISLLLYSINSVGRATIVKHLNFLRYGLYDIFAYVLSCVVGVAMAFNGYGYYSSIIAMVLHQLFITIFMYYLSHISFKLRIYKQHIKNIVSYSGWLTGSIIIRNLTHEIDKLITSQWMPVAVLGAYNRPRGFISQITGQLNNIFDTILFPILSGISDDKNKVKSSYEKGTNLIMLYSFILTSLFILGSDFLIIIFLGEKWLYLNNVFQILSFSIIFLCYGRLADCFFRSLGIVESFFYTRCCVLVCTIACIYIGCHYGIFGLALGYIISRVADCFVKILFLNHYIPKDNHSFYSNLVKTLYLPSLFFIGCYLLKIILPYGSLFSTLFFILIICLISVRFPLMFGRVFYENVHLTIKKKIRR